MTRAACPHCGKEIVVVSPGDLKALGITPNVLANEREKGRFPDPWLVFENRQVYLQEAIDQFLRTRGASKRQDIRDQAKRLPPEERRRLLEELSQDDDEPPASPSPRRPKKK